jgi:hypothetical protein
VIRRGAGMPGKKPVIGALLVIALAYVVYPYAALYRLGLAIRHGDAATLESMVDWYAVREGIKEDICDSVLDQPSQASGKLPPFGAGFVRGIASNAIDSAVTPEALASAAQQSETASVPQGASVRVSWAFFSSASAFEVELAAPGQPAPIKLQMELRDGTWQVTRVWLPPRLLVEANART